MHYKPEDTSFYAQKCGSEQLYVSLSSGDPMAFYLEVHLKNLDGLLILMLSQIGFWSGVHRAKTPNSKYLLQIEESSFAELAENSEYPIFSSSYFVSCGETHPDVSTFQSRIRNAASGIIWCVWRQKKGNTKNCLRGSMWTQ